MQENNNTLSAISLALENTSGIGAILTFILIAGCLGYFSYRARSLLFLRDRLWRLIGGKTEFHTAEFESLRKESRELEHFRMEFRVPVESMEDANKFLQWQKEKKIPTGRIALAHGHLEWTDFANPTVKKYLKTQAMLYLLLITILTTTSLASLAFIVSPYAIVSFPETPLFYLKRNEFKLSLFGDTITAGFCADESKIKKESIESDFPESRISDICHAIVKPETDKSIERFFKEQLSGGLSLLAISAIYLLGCIYSLIKLSSAKQIEKKLKEISSIESTPPPEQAGT